MATSEKDVEALIGEEPVDETPAETGQPAEKPAETPKEDHQVPLAKFLEVRNENKELKGRLDNLESTIVPQLQELRSAQQKPAEPEPEKGPDYMEDPQGYTDHQNKQIVDQLKKMDEKLGNQDQVLSQQEQMQTLLQHLGAAENSFAEENPDYYEALQQVREIRLAGFQEFYPQANPMQLQMMLRQQELRDGAVALQNNRNPAEAMYNVAKRMGYKAPDPSTPPGTDEDAQEEQARENAKEAAAGLGSSTGGGDDIQGLMDAGDDEFDLALKEMFGKQ